ncbi:oxygenase MpaB family protein [Rhodococcus sp. IEGM 1408]|uniref:oxygenase MpaB family protein n=1 Tax=Rhodococcus sp. IEGM 1408 TaxID=3082220 RepID=UPI0029554C28|nr:oxygenase MpaB family protein [Rhodococcus sp. IEGM 1408]MDV8000028.1 oxygenase MpaB family protein [Rhodococcus sp. IEGM 1408]
MTVGAAPARPIGAPTRFAADERWGRRAALLLRPFADVRSGPTPAERERISRALMSGDPVADDLLDAISRGDTSMANVREAVDACVAGEPGPAGEPAEVAEFVRSVAHIPAWLDPDLAARGARVCLRAGLTGQDVLGDLALLGGYRPAATTEVLASTGRLTGEGTATRVAETMAWWHAVAVPDGWRPGSPGWETTVHVRLMHARVNRAMLAKGWDVEAKGLPINQADMAATNGLFSATFLLGTLVLGIPHSPSDARAVMHLWRWMGHVMGVDEDFLHDRPRRGLRDMYHFLRTSPPPDANSAVLATSLLESYGLTDFPRFPRVRRGLDVARHKSTATYLNGVAGMRELGQRPTLPWYPALLIPMNLASHGAAAVSPRVRTALERRGDQRIRRQIVRYSRRTVAPLA